MGGSVVDLLVLFVHRLFIGSRGEPSSAAASLAFLTLQILQKSRNLQKVESICGKPHFASFNNQDVFLKVNQESHTNILTSSIWFLHWLWVLALDSFVINSCWVHNQLIAPLRVWPRSASRQGTAWEREQANEWLEPTRDDQQMPASQKAWTALKLVPGHLRTAAACRSWEPFYRSAYYRHSPHVIATRKSRLSFCPLFSIIISVGSVWVTRDVYLY